MIQPFMWDSLGETLRHVYSPNTLTVYVCGVTVYDYCHVGHGRVKVVFDVWRRWMHLCGQKVYYVNNITDIDDKIIAKAQHVDVPWDVLTKTYIDAMLEDESRLGIMPPDAQPRATAYIPEMIVLIETLMRLEKAYVSAEGDVCLEVRKSVDYGKLSKQNIDQLRADALLSQGSAGKKDVCDFVLWKRAKDYEPSWPSPWGPGRPGWHLECSAMAEHILGHPIDLHGGGLDLKFPHHENEIAQSEGAFGAPFSKHWMHVGLVDLDGVKMSKSLGNALWLKDILEMYGSDVIRLAYLKTHYRKPMSWSKASLDEAGIRASRYLRVCSLHVGSDENALSSGAWREWLEAMADDMNTPKALSIMDHWAKMSETSKPLLYAELLRKALEVFGIFYSIDSSNVLWIEALLEERRIAKTVKNYIRADEIRVQLANRGVLIEDTADTTRWYRA